MCKYCLQCDWRVSTANGYSETEVSRLAIEHFVETGHTIDSLTIPPPAESSVSIGAHSELDLGF